MFGKPQGHQKVLKKITKKSEKHDQSKRKQETKNPKQKENQEKRKKLQQPKTTNTAQHITRPSGRDIRENAKRKRKEKKKTHS